MDSSAVALSDIYMSAEELAEEIEYQNVLLLSLDDTATENRELAEAEIKAEIRKLERQLKALKQGQHGAMTDTSGIISYPYNDDPFTSVTTNLALSEPPNNPFPLSDVLSGLNALVLPPFGITQPDHAVT